MTAELVAVFAIPGEPVSKARARFTNYGSKTRAYTPAKTKDAEAAIAAAFLASGGRFEPSNQAAFGVDVTFHSGTRQRRDVDNMMKLILDGLNGVAWVDDTQVLDIVGRKRFTTRQDARTEVAIYRTGTLAEQTTQPCAECGDDLPTYESWKSVARYCSPCRQKVRHTKRGARARNCENCGLEFLSYGVTAKTRFCSRECQSANGRTTIPCFICGAEFEQFKSWANERSCCSPECSAERDKRRRSERTTTHFPGTCAICGAGTTRKEYRRCNPCKLAGKEVPA